MGKRPDDAGIYVAAGLAVLLGGLNAVIAGSGLIEGGTESTVTIRLASRLVLGVLLVPTAFGLATGAPWSRYVGIVAFGGLAVVQILPLVSGTDPAVPLLGILVAATCSVYLLLAPGAFDADGDDDRPIDEETDPHRFVR